jgi:hypothetical protein
MNRLFAFLFLVAVMTVRGFVPPGLPMRTGMSLHAATNGKAETTAVDPNETVARRIVVKGDVQGGYYRSCVLNEVRRWRVISSRDHRGCFRHDNRLTVECFSFGI